MGDIREQWCQDGHCLCQFLCLSLPLNGYFLDKRDGFFFKILFVYFWLRWVLVDARRLSLVLARVSCSLWRWEGFSLQWLLMLQAMGSRAQVQYLWCAGLVAFRHMGSSRTRGHTLVPALTGTFLTTESPGKSKGFLIAFVSKISSQGLLHRGCLINSN